MSDQHTPEPTRLRLFPPAPKGFDPFTATARDLQRHGLPRRPDPYAEPGIAALWERKAQRYRDFEHLEPVVHGPATVRPPISPRLGPDAFDSCGYDLFSSTGPFTALFITWTVPDLSYSSAANGIDSLHTFVGLGFLDVHVEMSVDSSEAVSSQLWAQSVGQVGLPVRPGDTLSASLCLGTEPPGRANYFITNETTAQTMSFTVDTGFPPAVTVNAGVTRDGVIGPGQPLARFGNTYFDEISAYTTGGYRSLTAGQAITMTDANGTVLARPSRLTDYAFAVVCA